MISLMTMIILYGPINKLQVILEKKNSKIICMELRKSLRSKATARTQTMSKTWTVGLKKGRQRTREK